MAEGWARALKSDILEPYSAGIETHGLNPNAVKVMAEAGIDITQQTSQHVDEFKDVQFDFVITVCGHAHESCPIFSGQTKVIHKGFDDPPKLAQNAKTEAKTPQPVSSKSRTKASPAARKLRPPPSMDKAREGQRSGATVAITRKGSTVRKPPSPQSKSSKHLQPTKSKKERLL